MQKEILYTHGVKFMQPISDSYDYDYIEWHTP